MKANDVMLGGTCGRSDWRDGFINRLVNRGVPREVLFNPILPKGVEWNKSAQEKEDLVKRTASTEFYYLGNPSLDEVLPYSPYSLVQLVDSCFNVTTVTRALLEPSDLSAAVAKSFNKSLEDLSMVSPGIIMSGWEEFVGEIAKLWVANRKLLGFLAGTSGNNPWRKTLIADLQARGVDISRFLDPVVPVGTWNQGVQYLEDQMRRICDHEFFYLSSPQEKRSSKDQFSSYSVVEAYIGLYKDRKRVVICCDYSELEGHSLQSLKKFEEDARKKFVDVNIFTSLQEAENFLVNRLI